MMPKIEAGRVGWSWLLAAGLLVGAQGCDKQAAKADENEAQAVESKDKEKKGAAAKKAEGKAKADKADEAPKEATIGEPAPDFTLTDASGNKHTLSDYKGKTVVLEWTNPDCPYVQRHYKAGTMSKTREKLGGKEKVVWLAIDSTHTNTKKESNKWKKKHGIEKPILQDTDGKVGKIYGAKTTPHMYVIDEQGTLRYRGAIDDDPQGDEKPKARTNYVLNAVKALQNGTSIEKKKTEAYGCSVKYGG